MNDRTEHDAEQDLTDDPAYRYDRERDELMIAEHQSDEHNRPGLRDSRCPLCVIDRTHPETITVPGGVERFTLTVVMQRTEEERRMGISSRSRRALRTHYEDAYPSARVRVSGPDRADHDTLTFVVEVVR